MRLNFRAGSLELLKIPLLQLAHLRAFDFSRSEGLAGGNTHDPNNNESGPWTSIFARKQFQELRKGDRKPSECRR